MRHVVSESERHELVRIVGVREQHGEEEAEAEGQAEDGNDGLEPALLSRRAPANGRYHHRIPQLARLRG
jgi:hypothetical protein